MAIHVEGDGRFRTLKLTVDREGDVGLQVIVGQSAGYSMKQLCAAFDLSRQYLSKMAAEARERLTAQRVP